MDGFGAMMLLLLLVGFGAVMGDLTSTHEVNIKTISQAQEICKEHEGLFVINSKRMSSSFSCKDGNEFGFEDMK